MIMEKIYILLLLFFTFFSIVISDPVKTSCNGGNWFIEDDKDSRYFYRCWGFMSGNLPRERCYKGTCVPPGFGAQDNETPCIQYCDNLLVPDTTMAPMGSQGFFCNFEIDDCGMTAESKFYTWKRQSGPTSTPDTGPNFDHTYDVVPGNGFYMYTDADRAFSGAESTLLKTPLLSIMEPSVLTFFYHMYGSTVYQLRVFLKTDTNRKLLWSRSGNQGNVWKHAKVALPGGIQNGYVIEFESRTNGSPITEGDIAIDDIVVEKGKAFDAEDCSHLKSFGSTADGWYKLKLNTPDQRVIEVKCLLDMGQTVIQERGDDSISFNQTWADYKKGFGNWKSFWAGLDNINYWTNRKTFKLSISIKDQSDRVYTQEYSNFVIGDEASKYTISLGSNLGGDAGDALLIPTNYLNINNRQFSTWDSDNDGSAWQCAREYESGWWFNDCWAGNLNGKWTTNSFCYYRCAQWKPLGDRTYKWTQMTIY